MSMTDREEEIRGRLDAIHRAAESKNHERLVKAFEDAEKHALKDVAWLIGCLDAWRKATGRVAG